MRCKAVLADVDALGKAEKQSWVWHGADCLAPDYKRCLVSISPGGTDADIVREWDRTTKSFVADGFTLPQAKSSVTWENADTLLVATDYGAGSMTASGYPRIVKRWKRGTPLSAATLVKEGVDVVMKRYPDYARLVKAAFSGPDMTALRQATARVTQ